MTQYPDINVQYETGSFDKDTGYFFHGYKIEQNEQNVVITEEEGLRGFASDEISNSVKKGIINDVDLVNNLVEIKFENGTSTCFDLKSKMLADNIQTIDKFFYIKSFNVDIIDDFRQTFAILEKIGQKFDPAFVLPRSFLHGWAKVNDNQKDTYEFIAKKPPCLYFAHVVKKIYIYGDIKKGKCHNVNITLGGLPSPVAITLNISINEGAKCFCELKVTCPLYRYVKIGKEIEDLMLQDRVFSLAD